jgi:hypothetical protein
MPGAQTDKFSGIMRGSGTDRSPPPSRFDGDATGLYTCQMHLNYRSDKPGKRTRCVMTLIPTTPAIIASSSITVCDDLSFLNTYLVVAFLRLVFEVECFTRRYFPHLIK